MKANELARGAPSKVVKLEKQQIWQRVWWKQNKLAKRPPPKVANLAKAANLTKFRQKYKVELVVKMANLVKIGYRVWQKQMRMVPSKAANLLKAVNLAKMANLVKICQRVWGKQNELARRAPSPNSPLLLNLLAKCRHLPIVILVKSLGKMLSNLPFSPLRPFLDLSGETFYILLIQYSVCIQHRDKILFQKNI